MPPQRYLPDTEAAGRWDRAARHTCSWWSWYASHTKFRTGSRRAATSSRPQALPVHGQW